MLIEIDTDTLKRLKLSANQLICLRLLMDKKNQKEYQNFIAVSPMTEAEIDSLKTKEYIVTDDNGNIEVTEKFTSLFDKNDLFDEFYDLYPKLIIRPDGTKDYLRIDVNRCRRYYNKIVGKSKTRHKHIIECLEAEINYRTQTNNMRYMKRMPRWLFNEEWQVGEELINDAKKAANAEDTYGNTVE